MFCDKLNEYMNLLDCSGKGLSEHSDISESVISRYRTGERTPKKSSSDIEKLCRGLYEISKEKGGENLSYNDIFEDFNALASDSGTDGADMPKKLNILINVLDINASNMSKSLKYDSSYISRIKNGQRKPSKPKQFAADTGEYIAKYYDGENDRKTVFSLIGTDGSKFKTKKDYAAAVAKWLTDEENPASFENPMIKFLEKLNDFDLEAYIRSVKFDKLKVPTLPFQLPTSKSYYGLSDMKNAELDFLKATALSKSDKRVFMFSDMQMDDMAQDKDFSKKYMFGLAMMLKKGLHLDVVHNLNRPFNELMLGLECWIPLYMTGLISPYYLNGVHNRIFCHFLNVSGAAALAGESISGFHAKGKYYLTKNKDELKYYRERSECILKKARPLMNIYRRENAAAFSAFLTADEHTSENVKSVLSAPPLYTATEEFLERFLAKRNVTAEEKRDIISHFRTVFRQIINITENCTAEDEVPVPTREEFEKFPPSLSLSSMFCEKSYEYTYEEYLEHIKLCEEFEKQVENYSFKKSSKNAFRNIQITIRHKKYVLISKNSAPTIHFVIRHPILRDAVENIDFKSFIE